MRAFIQLFVLFVSIQSGLRATSEEAKVLLIPLGPVTEQKLSDEMKARLGVLRKERVFSKLNTWIRIADLPAWVFEPEKREIAFVFGRPLVMHDYRYAIIGSGSGQLVIVRAGGLLDSYDVFVKEEPNQPIQPNAGGRPYPADSPASETPSSLGPRG